MKTLHTRSVLLAGLLLWCAIPLFSLPASRSLIASGALDYGERSSLGKLLLGASVKALSASFYVQADNYFHGGIGHKTRKAFENDPFQSIKKRTIPTSHFHASTDEMADILPWFQFAVWIDPGHIESYLNAAYVMAGALDNPEMAHSVLQQGAEANPENFELRLSRGRVFIKEHNYPAALEQLITAEQLWPSHFPEDNPDAIKFKEEILLYQSMIYEIRQDLPAAIHALRRIEALGPNHPEAIAKKRASLERGELTLSEDLKTLMENRIRQSETLFHEQVHIGAHDEPPGENVHVHDENCEHGKVEANKHVHGENCKHDH